MASTSEVGHAKNVANFQDLIAFVTGYGATYNPSKNSLQLPQLQALYTQANTSLDGVVAKNTNYNNAVNQRIQAFSNLLSSVYGGKSSQIFTQRNHSQTR